jgi:tRNA U34 5-methylaminomethyl-2-thiouridine-forming methyltransferase MnmC
LKRKNKIINLIFNDLYPTATVIVAVVCISNFNTLSTIITNTEDGSKTLYVPEIDEYYHSKHGARQESLHIFINAALKACEKTVITVFEVGFGTGLNALLSLNEAEKSQKIIDYKAVELFPLENEMLKQLNTYSDKEKRYFEAIHKAKWGEKVSLTNFFSLTKIQTDFTVFSCNFGFDVCYFDAFSPEKQPQMWENKRFEMLYDTANEDAILTTYCAKGSIRRTLLAKGFTVERLPGPPGKREFLRAQKK